jgi:hypothetical protein
MQDPVMKFVFLSLLLIFPQTARAQVTAEECAQSTFVKQATSPETNQHFRSLVDDIVARNKNKSRAELITLISEMKREYTVELRRQARAACAN